MDVHQHGLALQLRQLARERAGAMGDDQLAAAVFVALGDVDLAGQDDHQAGADLADRDQRLARAVGADLAEPPHAFDLRRLQRGKYLMASRFDDRRCLHGHDQITTDVRVSVLRPTRPT